MRLWSDAMLPATGPIEDALRHLAPAGVACGVRVIRGTDRAGLHPVERAHVARAVASRQAEYATGRALLRSLTGYDGPIPTAADRKPVLPEGWVGSLAHDRELAIAALSRPEVAGALGIDTELARPLEPGMADIILRHDEAGLDAAQAFCLKEALYKAWSWLGGEMLDHHDVRLRVTGTATAESGDFAGVVVSHGAVFPGRWARVDDRWLALVSTPPRA